MLRLTYTTIIETNILRMIKLQDKIKYESTRIYITLFGNKVRYDQITDKKINIFFLYLHEKVHCMSSFKSS